MKGRATNNTENETKWEQQTNGHRMRLEDSTNNSCITPRSGINSQNDELKIK